MSFLIDDEELSVEKKKALAIITLKRPKALNALTLEMIRLMSGGLKKISKDDEIKAVILRSSTPKAFCAGGDLKLASKLGMAYRRGEINNDIVDMYFKEEYLLDTFLYQFEKPIIAFMDGITMGGGVGISYPCKFRIATQGTRFAMPEVRIGFFPDVAGTYHLQKWPGETGMFAVTSGYHFKNPSDLLYLGACTHVVDTRKLTDIIPDLVKALEFTDTEDAETVVEGVLDKYKEIPSEKGEIETHNDLIDTLYSKDCFDDVYEAFHNESNDFMREVNRLFHHSSPISMKVSYEYYNMNKGEDFETIINRDARLVARFVEGHDFYEGIRSVLIDKTEPVWDPAKLHEVSDDMVGEYLANLKEGENIL